MSNGLPAIPESATVQDIFEKFFPQSLPEASQKYKDVFQSLNGVLQFLITGDGGGNWHFIMGGGEIKVAPGQHESPTTTFTIEAQDYLSLAQRKADPQMLFMSGKLKVAGDMSLAMRLGQIMRSIMETAGAAAAQPAAATAAPAAGGPDIANMSDEDFKKLMENVTSVATVFNEYMPARFTKAYETHKDLLSSIQGILQFNVTGDGGGNWHIEMKGAEGGGVKEGSHDAPTTTFTVDSADWLSVVQRKSDPQMLFMSGKLKVAGDMSLAMRLGQVMRNVMGS